MIACRAPRPATPLRGPGRRVETAARSAEVLALNVKDLDLANRCVRVRRKSGPVFVTEREARVQLPACDLDPDGCARLSYQQAEALFSEASGGATLHQLRHSALTHGQYRGQHRHAMLMARSGHTSVRSLAKYARSRPRRWRGTRSSATGRGGAKGRLCRRGVPMVAVSQRGTDPAAIP